MVLAERRIICLELAAYFLLSHLSKNISFSVIQLYPPGTWQLLSVVWIKERHVKIVQKS